MISAIRIEHSDGQGMFTSIHYLTGKCRKTVYEFLPSVSERHYAFPCLKKEMHYKNSKDNFCAYKTIEQLNEWILPDEITVLIDKGYKIYLLDLSEAIVTDYQVIFKKEHIIHKKDITQLFEQKKKTYKT